MCPEKYDLTSNGKEVYEYLLKVKEATKQSIIKETSLISEKDYAAIRHELLSKGLARGKMGRTGGLVLSSSKSQKKLLEKEGNKIAELSQKAGRLWSFIPEDGSFATNLSLRNKLRPVGFSTEEYWKYRKELLDDNLIQIRRGRGGSVARLQRYVAERIAPPKGKLVKEERKLYEELKKWLQKNRATEIEQSGGQAWVVITGPPGKWKRKSGQWSRPDVVLVERPPYEFLPSAMREVDIKTYEIKKYKPQMDSSWVFEAASHSKCAHYSYFVLETLEEKAKEEAPPPDELLPDLNQFEIGFGWIYCNRDTEEYEFKEVLEHDRGTPNPEDANNLLRVFYDKLKPKDKTTYRTAIRY